MSAATCSLGCPSCKATRLEAEPASLEQGAGSIPAVAYRFVPCARAAVMTVPAARAVEPPRREEAST